MLFRTIPFALVSAALMQGSVLAQSPHDAQNLPQKIHDDLVSRGFTDVKVVPQSFVISAKDKAGNPIVMLLGPNSMTVLSAPPSDDPNTARRKDDDDKLIQQ